MTSSGIRMQATSYTSQWATYSPTLFFLAVMGSGLLPTIAFFRLQSLQFKLHLDLFSHFCSSIRYVRVTNFQTPTLRDHRSQQAMHLKGTKWHIMYHAGLLFRRYWTDIFEVRTFNTIGVPSLDRHHLYDGFLAPPLQPLACPHTRLEPLPFG